MALPTDSSWGYETMRLEQGQGERIALAGDDFLDLKVTAAESNGELCFFEMTCTPGHPGIPLHYHNSHEELWYILEGTLNMQIGDDEILAQPRSTYFVPRKVPHRFWNASDKPCFFISTFTPAGYEGWFRERTQLLRDGKATPKALAELGQKYDHVLLERIPSTMTTREP